MNLMNSYENYLTKIKPLINEKEWNSVLKVKDQYKNMIQDLGLPKRSHESWKNTSVKFLNDLNFQYEIPNKDSISEKVLTLIKKAKLKNCHSVVLLNGIFLKGFSEFNDSQIEIACEDLGSLCSEKIVDEDDLENSYSTPFTKSIRIINRLFKLQKTSITIKAQTKDLKPIQIINVTASSADLSIMSNPSIELILEPGAKATVLNSMIGLEGLKYFNNLCIKISQQPNSNLEFINQTQQSYQAYHFDQILFELDKNACLTFLDFNLSSLISRHELIINLNEMSAQALVLGAALLQKTEHCDHQTKIHFKFSQTSAEQLYKYILDDDSRGVFSGTVFIDKNLEGVSSKQLNKNLLLSDRAQVNTKPVLMIHSDDVKASHGTTIGQLNHEEIFYLQSRAIAQDRAKELLSVGFLQEIIEKINHPFLKKYLEQELYNKFAKTKLRPTVKDLR